MENGDIVFPFSSFSVEFYPQGRVAQDFAGRAGCQAVVNGSYFGYTDETKKEFRPVGVWNSSLFTGASLDDPNLQEVVRMREDQLFLDRYTQGLVCGEGEVCFSAGPLLIQSGVVQPEVYENISHRQGSYPRTVLVQTIGNTYVYVVTGRISIGEVAGLIDAQWGEDIIFAVNLDGGPSTSYFDIEQQFGWNSESRLPLWLCLH